MRKLLLFILLTAAVSLFRAQTLSLQQVHAFTTAEPDVIESSLLKEGWKRYNMQVVRDSNFIRRSWEVLLPGLSTKSFFLHYQFNNDPLENYVVYQFPERERYNQYKDELKKEGYRELNKGKSKKRVKSKDSNIHNVKEDYYYSEKLKKLTVVKEEFFYGLFSFLVYSYYPDSKTAQQLIRDLNK